MIRILVKEKVFPKPNLLIIGQDYVNSKVRKPNEQLHKLLRHKIRGPVQNFCPVHDRVYWGRNVAWARRKFYTKINAIIQFMSGSIFRSIKHLKQIKFPYPTAKPLS